MFSSRNEYDRGVNQFSPEGRLFQIEYAEEAIKLGSTGIAMKIKDGVILAAEKRIESVLLEPQSIQKIAEIDYQIGCLFSGLTADARMLVEQARQRSQMHRFTFNEPMSVESCTQTLGDLAISFGEDEEDSMSRPFGVALLIAGWDMVPKRLKNSTNKEVTEKYGPKLYYLDPSGTFVQYDAKAIGSGSEGAQTTLEEKYDFNMPFHQTEELLLSTLKQVMEEKITDSNVDIASVVFDEGLGLPIFKQYNQEQVKNIIQRL